MALSVISAPGTSDPIPVSDCLQWVFQPDDSDVVQTPGVKAQLVVVFPNSPTAPADGTTFVIWGFNMTVDSAEDYTATSFDVVAGDQGQTINNFVSMLNSNFYFNRAVSIGISGGTVTITWDQCGEQVNFGTAQMSFANIIGNAITSATPTNGTTPIYVDGYRVSYRLFRHDINDSLNSGPITAYEGMEPNKDCTGSDTVAFDGMPEARKLIHTPLPELDNAHPTVDFDGIVQYFSLQYGWVYRDANCQPLSGIFNFNGRPFVWNAYFQPEDVYRVRKYWPGATGGLPPGQSYVKFLTTQPDKIRVLIDSKIWLWYMTNEAVQNWVKLILYITVTKKDGSGTFKPVEVFASGYGVNAVNVSPSYILSLGISGLTADNLDFYTVKIMTQNSGSPFDLTQIVETKSYYITEKCNNDKFTDLYFLTPIGGIGTIPVELIEKNAVQSGDEILLDVPCTATRTEQAKYGGRTLSNIRAYESLKFRSLDNSPGINDFLKDLKLSPQRWVRRRAEDGSFVARKFIVDTGGVKVFQDGPTVTVEISGFLGDIQIQSITENKIG